MEHIRNKAPVMRKVQTEYEADFVSAHQFGFDSDLESMAGWLWQQWILTQLSWMVQIQEWSDMANDKSHVYRGGRLHG